MDLRKLTLASILVAGSVACLPLAQARVDVEVVIAPPAPIVEAVPAPRVGYAWAPGYWHWNGHRHVWHSGYWMRNQPGQHWVAHNWEHRGDHWYLREGHWDHN